MPGSAGFGPGSIFLLSLIFVQIGFAATHYLANKVLFK